MAKTPLIVFSTKNQPDGHNDFPFIIRGLYQNHFEREGFDLDTLPIGQTDFIRLREGHVGGQFWSAFIPCAKPGGDATRSDLVVIETLQQIDLIHAMIEKYPHILSLARTADEVWEVFRSGRIASLIGIEGLHQIADSVSVLRTYHRLGVRYITLTHNCDNRYATSSSSNQQTGLSDDGKRIIKEMNRIGIVGVTPHPRNASDEVLDLLQQNGGVIMVCFLPNLVAPTPLPGEEKQTPKVSDVVNHIIYIGERIGFAHVGIGSDFDGMLHGPQGLDDVSQYPNLVAELLRSGLSDDDVQGIMGLNALRVLQAVEQITRRICRCEGISMQCDEIDAMWTPQQESLLRQAGASRVREQN
ncbi:uncharacterized protein N7484_000441 [Penicillium longicatenatum]|uniref:uncharacterized protein n=1 Tax=Penicillium longicatenatum TaxID=1561947 RepID=UPI0025480582|nr:uncharacterized protein N7484_000441 [Penicillium longicatenatum]KAJ5661069.1 hypothetical protein N7484_000441 [Penicillium longicatenatum]